MTILVHLNDLCTAFPACRAVAYCDLTTGMVLCSGSQQKLPQEQLDQLGLGAAEVLNSDLGSFGPIQTVVLVQNQSVNFVLRSKFQPNEALSCDCDMEIDLHALGLAAEKILVGISGVT